MGDDKKKPKNAENQENEVTDEKTSRPFMKWVKLGIVVAGLLGEAYGAYAVMNVYYPTIYQYLNKKPTAEADNIFEIDDLIVNPAMRKNGDPHFLVASLGINLETKEDIDVLKNRESMAKDAIITVLGKYNMDELKDLLKREEIKQKIGIVVNRVLEKNAVKDLYFTKFVIQ